MSPPLLAPAKPRPAEALATGCNSPWADRRTTGSLSTIDRGRSRKSQSVVRTARMQNPAAATGGAFRQHGVGLAIPVLAASSAVQWKRGVPTSKAAQSRTASRPAWCLAPFRPRLSGQGVFIRGLSAGCPVGEDAATAARGRLGRPTAMTGHDGPRLPSRAAVFFSSACAPAGWVDCGHIKRENPCARHGHSEMNRAKSTVLQRPDRNSL